MHDDAAASGSDRERWSSPAGGRGRVLLGADVGATSIGAGLVTEAGEVVTFERVATHGRGRGTALAVLLEMTGALLGAAGREGRSVSGIGIGLPGIVDAERGMMVSDQNYVPEFADVPLAGKLRATTGVPAFVDNDANALALGELEFGAGRGVGTMALLAIGTNVGGAIVLGGKVVRGHSGCAGEFGHIPLALDGPLCLCGGRSCLNMYIAGEALARAGRDAVARRESSKLLALAAGDPQRITAPLVFEAAAAGDAAATALVERACMALGAAIGGIVNTLDPELLVVTGGVAGSFVALERTVLEWARRYALAPALARTRLRIIPADKRRMVLGGAALALTGLRQEAATVVAGSAAAGGRDATGRQ